MVSRNNEEGTGSAALVRRYGKGQLVFAEGSSGNEMYLISRGRVELSVDRGKPTEVCLAVLGEGDFFGEMALVDDCTRSASAVALEDGTELLALDKPRFIHMLRHQPQFALSVMHTLCERLRLSNQRPSPGRQ